MDWLSELHKAQPIAHAIGVLAFVCVVGMALGAKFFGTVFSATGLQWLLAGVCVTMLPLLVVGIFARMVLKMNFMDLSGLLAGSMTDPPALAFAGTLQTPTHQW